MAAALQKAVSGHINTQFAFSVHITYTSCHDLYLKDCSHEYVNDVAACILMFILSHPCGVIVWNVLPKFVTQQNVQSLA